MATWGDCNFKELAALQDRFNRLVDEDWEQFCKECLHELAAKLLALVIPATPVGKYSIEIGKKGGTLRRGWTGGKYGGKGQTYVKMLRVTKRGGTYSIEVINPTRYASYVEYGHRQTPGRYVPAIGRRLKKSWSPGKLFLQDSEIELVKQIPKMLEDKLQKLFKEVLDG